MKSDAKEAGTTTESADPLPNHADAHSVPAALSGERLDRALSLLAGCSRAESARLISDGCVTLDAAPCNVRSERVREGQRIRVSSRRPPAAPAADQGPDPEVVWVDGSLIVVDKPAGLVVHPGAGQPGGTLTDALVATFPDLAGVGQPDRPGIVHRLDKNTSGLMVVARTDQAYASLVRQMSERSVLRRYKCLVKGRVEADAGVVDAPVGRARRDPTRMTISVQGRPARTRYSVIARFDAPFAATLVEAALETGRTHQVRVHMSGIGHPVVGDQRYGGATAPPTLRRPFLHAWRLGLHHPESGDWMEWTSEIPEPLVSLLGALRSEGAEGSGR